MMIMIMTVPIKVILVGIITETSTEHLAKAPIPRDNRSYWDHNMFVIMLITVKMIVVILVDW